MINLILSFKFQRKWVWTLVLLGNILNFLHNKPILNVNIIQVISILYCTLFPSENNVEYFSSKKIRLPISYRWVTFYSILYISSGVPTNCKSSDHILLGAYCLSDENKWYEESSTIKNKVSSTHVTKIKHLKSGHSQR